MPAKSYINWRFLLFITIVIFSFLLGYSIVIRLSVGIRLDFVFYILINVKIVDFIRYTLGFLPVLINYVFYFFYRYKSSSFLRIITPTILSWIFSVVIIVNLLPSFFPKSALCQIAPNCTATVTGSLNERNDGLYEPASPSTSTAFVDYLLQKRPKYQRFICPGEMYYSVDIDRSFSNVTFRRLPADKREKIDLSNGASIEVTYCDKPLSGNGTTTQLTLTIRDRNYAH